MLSIALGNGLHAAPPTALNRIQVIELLAGGVPTERVAMLVREHGIDFRPSADYFDELRREGADNDLVHALLRAQPRSAAVSNRSEQKSQAAIEADLVRAAEDTSAGQTASAEAEYRTAIAVTPETLACTSILAI
jgi:hypothetical protein